ncbi:stage V sporulation protein AE [Oikeobacillus pervagus]|uniref:Stage V sporulation protein AE n=1 Tax=Oikeobacillus pervagus TaxID=1325931 RepID=A0AAJ1WHM0_9BACI|nr:stage V sporulation protein AE [Oikeobacillus pervagus]MDQ0213750.1 stage V sporulation protein AE [Oikeobacillus pervagus]
MKRKRKVIIVTDGDEYARRAIETVARQMGARCISRSAGNPTLLTGAEIVHFIKKAACDPVFVMFDDSGWIGEGPGEEALKYVVNHGDIEVLGALAVASNTHQAEWTKVDISMDRTGELTHFGVDKFGVPEMDIGRINGDTVYCLDRLPIPIIVGIGDIGKMTKKDHYLNGSQITKKAVDILLERSGYDDRRSSQKGAHT